MTTRKHAFYGILALVSLLGLGITQSARASFIATINQVGNDVVVTGSGAIDLTGLTFVTSGNLSPNAIEANLGIIQMGGNSNIDQYIGITGPTSFGSGGLFLANTSSGDFVGIFGLTGNIDVPQGYVSGAALSDSMIFNNVTFASLGVTPGTYTWTWGTGIHADSFELQIVPEPSTLALIALTSIGAGVMAYRRRK